CNQTPIYHHFETQRLFLVQDDIFGDMKATRLNVFIQLKFKTHSLDAPRKSLIATSHYSIFMRISSWKVTFIKAARWVAFRCPPSWFRRPVHPVEWMPSLEILRKFAILCPDAYLSNPPHTDVQVMIHFE